MSKSNTHAAQKLAVAGVLTAAAVVGSFLSVPVAGSKCAPVQHMVNVFSAVLLGPWWGICSGSEVFLLFREAWSEPCAVDLCTISPGN